LAVSDFKGVAAEQLYKLDLIGINYEMATQIIEIVEQSIADSEHPIKKLESDIREYANEFISNEPT